MCGQGSESKLIIFCSLFKKLVQKSDSIPSSEPLDKDKYSHAPEPYRRMMPGMKLADKGEATPTDDDKLGDSKKREEEDGEGEEEEEEEEEEEPSLPTPRKRLMNFKIPLVKGSQRRDQQQSVFARRRLYRDGRKEEGVLKLTPMYFTLSISFSLSSPLPPKKYLRR